MQASFFWKLFSAIPKLVPIFRDSLEAATRPAPIRKGASFAGMTGSGIQQYRNFDLRRWWIWGIIYELVYLGSRARGWREWVYFGEAGSKVIVYVIKKQVFMEDTK